MTRHIRSLPVASRDLDVADVDGDVVIEVADVVELAAVVVLLVGRGAVARLMGLNEFLPVAGVGDPVAMSRDVTV